MQTIYDADLSCGDHFLSIFGVRGHVARDYVKEHTVMLSREHKIRVRYKETDTMGVVHHSNYVTYYEEARTEMLRELGATYRQLEDSGIMLPVAGVEMKFYTPALYDDLLTVRTTLMELPAAKMLFEYEVRNEKGELVNTGNVKLVFMDAARRRACRAPGWFLDIFRPFFE